MKLDLLVLLSAMATQEGFFTPTSIAAKNANPGNLRFAGQEGSKPSQYGGPIPFAQFTSLGVGTAACLRLICKYIQEGASLKSLIYHWAPPTGADGGNNSALYVTEVTRRIKAASGLDVNPDLPLYTYLPLTHII
jgi:hypothetical protein